MDDKTIVPEEIRVENLQKRKDENMKKNIRSDSGVSLENIDNRDNLDKYIECEKKMDDDILCNLLKNVQRSLPTSGLGSEDEYDGEYSTTSNLDYKSLIEALSSCDLNKSKSESQTTNGKGLDETDKNELTNKKKSVGSEICDIGSIFSTNKNKNEKNKKPCAKNETRNKNHKEREKATNSGIETENLSSKAIMEQLSAKISTMNLAKQEKVSRAKSNDCAKKGNSVAKKTEPISVNCNDKNRIKIVPRESQNKKDKKYTILLERGPWSKPKTYGVRNTNPFYQGNQQLINANIFSGGKFWSAEEPAELIPKTIPDFEGLLTKPVSEGSNRTEIKTPNAPSVESNNLENILSPSTIAAVLEKEVLSLSTGSDNEGPIQSEPDWSDYELVKNILEREAGFETTAEENIMTPSIVVDECSNENTGHIQHGKAMPKEFVETCETSPMAHQFIIKSPTSDRVHEVSYRCQRIDQLTPLSQTSAFTFDTQNFTHENNSMSQNFEPPLTPTDLRSPLQLYSPADGSLSLKVPQVSYNFYSPPPSIYSTVSSSPEQTYVPESPGYSKTSNLDQEFVGINNSLMNETAFRDVFPKHIYSPNDSSIHGSSRSNRSSFCGSDYYSEPSFSSPNTERIENHNYDNMYETSSPSQPSTVKESLCSSSPLESPEIYLDPNELEIFTNTFTHTEHTNETGEYFQNEQGNSSDVCLQLFSVQNQTIYEVGYEANPQTTSTKQTFNTQISPNTPSSFSSQPSHTISVYSSKNETKDLRSAKSSKAKPISIAPKQSYPCCTKMNKNAKESLDDMFQRLDKNMQSNLLLKVHTLDDNNVMKLLDTLLAGWGYTKLPIPRLSFLYVICERLMMDKATRMKFFKTYGNGHTILDRALLTCPQSPILSRYIAECSIKAMESFQNNKDITLDKTDSQGNNILHRAIYAGVECAAALANLLQVNTGGCDIFNVNKLNAEGYSPVHLACSIHFQQTGGLVCSCLIMTHILLEHGNCDPNVKDGKSGATALHTAVNSNGCSSDLVSLLLKYGADPTIRNYYSSTPLDLAKSACRSSNNTQCARQVVEILKKLKKPY